MAKQWNVTERYNCHFKFSISNICWKSATLYSVHGSRVLQQPCWKHSSMKQTARNNWAHSRVGKFMLSWQKQTSARVCTKTYQAQQYNRQTFFTKRTRLVGWLGFNGTFNTE